MIRAFAAFCVYAVLASDPAAARTVDYNQSEAQFGVEAAAIGAPAPAAAPGRGQLQIVLEDAERLDHRLVVLGISCSAWRVDNPLSQMVRRALSSWDADGALEPTSDGLLLRVRIAGAGSDIRCVEVREMNMSCIVRTRINGEIYVERPGAEPAKVPFSIEDQQLQSRPGACGSLSRGTGLSGRAATLRLIERLEDAAARLP